MGKKKTWGREKKEEEEDEKLLQTEDFPPIRRHLIPLFSVPFVVVEDGDDEKDETDVPVVDVDGKEEQKRG